MTDGVDSWTLATFRVTAAFIKTPNTYVDIALHGLEVAGRLARLEGDQAVPGNSKEAGIDEAEQYT